MDTVVSLCTTESCLELRVNIHKWCRCYLISGGEAIFLGAEHVTYVGRALLTGLTGPLETVSGHAEGVPVMWVASLAEKHCSLYVAREGERRIMLWQDAHARWIGRMEVTPEQLSSWLVHLSAVFDAQGQRT